ncbi:hypothetical protein EJ02DRAFT_182933 [Clathrospora elynae]|uniref:Uncharacterized protein n=1 Tax=Clathrospora elynae TaxID=706981 RepID=A0A6A5SQR5_9PLEO|nr:hypothetical protein EJ02DRAFT_182933 [Clathrospora elynae]
MPMADASADTEPTAASPCPEPDEVNLTAATKRLNPKSMPGLAMLKRLFPTTNAVVGGRATGVSSGSAVDEVHVAADVQHLILEADPLLPLEDQPLDLGAVSELSPLERIPTELLEQIASCLVCNSGMDPLDAACLDDTDAVFGFGGLLELRATSRTIRAKVDYTFTGCFKDLIVSFTERSSLGLLELSHDETLRHRVRSLIFVAPKLSKLDIRSNKETICYRRRLEAAMRIQEMQDLVVQHPRITALLIVAMDRFRKLKYVCVAPSLNRCYPKKVRDSITGENPPVVVLSAAILSKPWLERLEIGTGGWGSYNGMQPSTISRIVSGIRSRVQLQDLTSLTLCLNGSTLPLPAREDTGHFISLLSHCYNLERLQLEVDKATIDETWPNRQNSYRIWIAISHRYNFYWKLRELKLSGFSLIPGTLIRFLAKHRRSLVSLHFDNCALYGPWLGIVQKLRGWPGLQELVLHQISQGLQRVVWVTPFCQLLDDKNEEGWVEVFYGGDNGATLNFEGQDRYSYTTEILKRMRVIRKKANPFASDALMWSPDRLTG